ncbi:MaoC family dehydratase [Rhizobium sp. C4]|uniref:MaoC family dehydratase n=1 Tax=Rhizobium sp. C4 TaxID=1349800 RepID=UPI001E5E4E92|nr:MaoC family dehydratase N-terminal domain-containing protein [Rhizobium sp. C4]MCD2172256.1 MaoC family dehydratase N-terminal domain-containing protein [Rhizobium sp. C4]
MDVLGLGLFYEDLPVGRSFKTIGRTITETDIINFTTCTGMTEVLFTNHEFQDSESDIQGRVSPGALVFTFSEGLLVHASMQHTGFAFLSMDLEIKGPTVAGDTIHVEVEVIESRRSASRPTRGLVRTRNKVVNQKGETIMVYTPLRMVKARTDGKAA